MFFITLENYHSDVCGRVFLDLTVAYKNKNLFDAQLTAVIDPQFEDGLMIKDADFLPSKKFVILTNSLLSEDEIKELKTTRYCPYYFSENENPNPLKILQNQLYEYLGKICEEMTFAVHIPHKLFSNHNE